MSDKCNSCGAEIEYSAGSQSLKCQYCGAINKIQKEEDQLPNVVEKIIPLTVSQDDLEKRTYSYMASGHYTPDDMLEVSTFIKKEFIYVAAYLIRIKYAATWTASFGYDRTEHYTVYESQSLGTDSRGHSRGTRQVPVTKTKTVTDWRPANGVDSGIFPVSTYAGKKLGESLLMPVELVPYIVSKGSITDFNPSFIKGVETESFSVSAASAYTALKSEINSNIDNFVQRNGQGDHQKDWQWNAKMSHETNTIYVPICHAVFDYEGTEYHVWIDGIGESEIRADKLPMDKGRQKLVYMGFAPLGFAVATLLTSYLSGTYASGEFVIAVLFAGYAVLRRKYILEYSKKIRDSLLTQIHASANTVTTMNDAERDKAARSFQRPKKPFLANTHYDKFVLPILSILAIFLVLQQNTVSKEKEANAKTLASKSANVTAPAIAPKSPAVVQPDTIPALVAISSVPANLSVENSSLVTDWVKLIGSKDGELTLYVNPSTIRKAGDKATIWEMIDSKTAKVSTNSGKAFLSQKNQNEFDCKENKLRILNIYSFHAGHMGSGEITDTNSASSTVPGEWSQVPPKSVMDAMSKIACGQS